MVNSEHEATTLGKFFSKRGYRHRMCYLMWHCTNKVSVLRFKKTYRDQIDWIDVYLESCSSDPVHPAIMFNSRVCFYFLAQRRISASIIHLDSPQPLLRRCSIWFIFCILCISEIDIFTYQLYSIPQIVLINLIDKWYILSNYSIIQEFPTISPILEEITLLFQTF